MPAASSPDLAALLPIFDALPAPYLLLTPGLVIEAASDAFLVATLTQRADLLGRYLFDVFPDNPDAPEANGVGNLRASLEQVLATGQPHEMARQRYDAPDPTRPGHFVERHWLPRNTPVLDAQGQVSHIIHAVINITDQLTRAGQLQARQAREQAAYATAEAQRQQLYQTFQEAPAMICVFDGPQHTFQFVNPPYQALVGNRPLVGKPIAEAMPELAGQPVFDLLDSVYRTGETFRASEMLVQLDHDNTGAPALENRYYNFIYQARHDVVGEITGIYVFAYDVTTQALARQQVQNLNEELAATNEELHASNEEFLQANAELTHTQLQLQQLNQELEMRVAARTQDARAARADTERQRRQLEDLFMRAPAAICIFGGPNWVYELVNPGYQQMFPGRRLLGLPLLQALPEVAGQPLVAILTEVYTTGIPFEGKEVLVPLARYEGGPIEDIYFDLTYQARFNEVGHIDGFTTYAYDVTAQVLARQQVQTLNEELAAINEELAAINEELHASNEELGDTNHQLTRTNVDLDNFIYTASHDLKQPIANIEGLLQALTLELPAEARRAGLVQPILERMQAAVERFQKTIGDLTEVSKLQQVHTQPAQEVLLRQVIEEVILDLDPALAAHGRLEVAVPPDHVVTFSEKNLRSVVYNLLSNALKYRAPNRPLLVRITSKLNDNSVELRVQDNGLGLDRAQQARLFGLFQRLHTHVEGTGIGLYMVKKIVENAGGTIAVQSDLGVGSSFIVSLPN